jgi:zinc protease
MIRAGVLTAPRPSAPVARAGLAIRQVVSPGGVVAWLHEDRSIPILTLQAHFRGGASLDADGTAGATALATTLLSEGAGDRDAVAFSTAREELAARFGFSAGRDGVIVSATMLAENRDASLDLLRLALPAPRYDADAVERGRGRTLSALRAEETEPRALASRAFYAAAFPDHPYGRPARGRLDTVAALTAADLHAARSAALARDRLQVAAVGDVGAEELGDLLDRLFGDLPARGAPLPPTVAPTLDGSVRVIDLDIPQSVVVFGQAGFARLDPDFVAAMVLDHILGGGGFSSRLMREMREVRGLTYGVHTHLSPGEFGALYLGGFSTSNARVAEAVALLRAEWARMASDGATETELADAKRYLTGAYPLRFDGNARIADSTPTT